MEIQQQKQQEQQNSSDQDFSSQNYGFLSAFQTDSSSVVVWTSLSQDLEIGSCIRVRARLACVRGTGKQAFLVFRQRHLTIQGIAAASSTSDGGCISRKMLKFIVSSIPKESIVDVIGTVSQVPAPVESCTHRNCELKIEKIFVVSAANENLPFQLEDASRPEIGDAETPRVLLDTRLNHRTLDLRICSNQAIFAIQSGVCTIFREFLLQRKFIEIHTPKIISAASEGGANVFKLGYFKGDAYLAQSPQLYKQMAICGDFERVFEIAPVFRAENSFSHRHMTEFVGLDLEMSFMETYHEVMFLIAELFVYLFDQLRARFGSEIEAIRAQYQFEDFVYLRNTLVVSYREGVEMLRAGGYPELEDHADLSTEQERTLGRLVKERYGTDFYVLDKFPLAVRPFYTQADLERPGYANAYDFFMRGEEIMSGAQRIHDYGQLVESAKAHSVDLASIAGYLEAFKYGAPPHAGGGVGLERVVMLFFGLGNIRRTSMFPRDPKRLFP